MKNRQINSKAFNLAGYAALAGSFLGIPWETGAQAVYVDIDPDTILSIAPSEAFLLDIDNDGVNDFTFQKFANTIYTDWCGCDVYRSEIDLTGFENKAVFSTYLFSTNTYLVAALDVGTVINDELLFNHYDAKMAYKLIPEWSIYYLFEGGDWYPEAVDKFVGIKFKDSLECTHYGWIRCTINENGEKLTIKDYAYENKCDMGIIAGDMIGDTTVPINEKKVLDALVYTFNNRLYVKTENYAGCSLAINNLQGQNLLHQDLKENLTLIDLETIPAGIYVVVLMNQKSIYTKEINIH